MNPNQPPGQDCHVPPMASESATPKRLVLDALSPSRNLWHGMHSSAARKRIDGWPCLFAVPAILRRTYRGQNGYSGVDCLAGIG